MKKYLSIEEAAQMLGMDRSELNRLREKGEIRAFADRGTWKFKEEDIEKLMRTRQPDSNPDVALYDAPKKASSDDDDTSQIVLGGDDDDSALSEQPTTIRRTAPLDASDSDVRLIRDPTPGGSSGDIEVTLGDSDSDVRLAKDPQSDKKLAAEDSDSDVKIADLSDSDSDVKLVSKSAAKTAGAAKPGSDVKLDSKSGVKKKADSDSDVKLAGTDSGRSVPGGTDSDVALISDSKETKGPKSDKKKGSALALPVDLSDTDSGHDLAPLSDDLPLDDKTIDLAPASGGSALDEEAGVPLAEGSGLALTASESGISLDMPNDSGIALDGGSALTLASGSGISLDIPSGSGISLGGGDSGISLDDAPPTKQPASGNKKGKKAAAKDDESEDDFGHTIPMLDSPLAGDDDLVDATMEVPLLSEAEGGSDFDADLMSDDASGSGDNTSVITLDDEADVNDYSATMVKKGGAEEEEDLEVTDDAEEIVGEDDELEELDVFGAEDEDFDAGVQTGESHADIPIAAGRMAAPIEQEWGTGLFVTLSLSTVLMVACGTVMFDLVRNMWFADVAEKYNPASSFLLEQLRGLFG